MWSQTVINGVKTPLQLNSRKQKIGQTDQKPYTLQSLHYSSNALVANVKYTRPAV